MAGILSHLRRPHAVIPHNEVSNLAYDGIDTGWGWGINDAGGSKDYLNRGLYKYQPSTRRRRPSRTPTSSGNLVHGTKKVFPDGGSIYNLSANPGAGRRRELHLHNLTGVGLYLDEGSRYVTLKNNVVQDCGVWVFTNAYRLRNNTSDNTSSTTGTTPAAPRRRTRPTAQQPADRQRPGGGYRLAGRRSESDSARRHRAAPADLPRGLEVVVAR